MLFADKQALETDLKVSLLAIRERELELYAENCRNIGAQAALLAGFAYSALTFEVAEVDDVCTFALAMKSDCSVMSRDTVIGGLYQLIAYGSMALNTLAVFRSLLASMLGPGLALRGQDGAMDQAVEGLALEYRTTFVLFLAGIFSFFLYVALFLAIDYDDEYGWADAILHVLLVLGFLRFFSSTLSSLKRIWKKFRLPPEASVSGSFDPDGTGGGGRQRSAEALELDRLSVHKTWREWPRRQYLYCTVAMDEILGISNKIFQERYQRSAREKISSARGRPKNSGLHSIIRYLERPSARGAGTLGARSDASLRAAAPPTELVASSTRATPPPAAGGSSSSAASAKPAARRWGWPGSWGAEEKVGLAAHDSAGDHLQSGAISPADSETS